MTEAPKDYEEDGYWTPEPESVAAHRQTKWMLICIGLFLIGFLIGWTI